MSKILNNNIASFFITFLSIISLFFFILLLLSYYNPKSKYLQVTSDKNILIYKYQSEKINSEKINEVDTLYLGDSSLGNSINSSYINNTTDFNSLNLSLTKTYGFSGIYNLLIKYHKLKSNNIKNIVVMIGYDFLDSDFEEEGFYLSSNKIFSFIKISDFSKWTFFNFKYLFKYLQNIEKKNNNYYEKYIENNIINDYTRQNARDQKKFIKSTNIKKYLQDKIDIFDLIYNYCIINNLNLILINGPIYEKIYYNNENKIIEFDKYFSNYKDVYINERVLLSQNEIGDFPMHVKNDYKIHITKKFLKIIEPKLLN